MDRSNSRRVFGLLGAAATYSVALVAAAWELSAPPIEIEVNDHVFTGAKVWNEGCKLQVRVDFDAPQAGYASRAPNRNYHRFQARLKFAGDRVVTSPVFFNRNPGRRMYTFAQESSDGGCWAQKQLKLQDVDVVGCRGERCKLDPFSD